MTPVCKRITASIISGLRSGSGHNSRMLMLGKSRQPDNFMFPPPALATRTTTFNWFRVGRNCHTVKNTGTYSAGRVKIQRNCGDVTRWNIICGMDGENLLKVQLKRNEYTK